uniref:Uncharacterized protein n=1 Tax=Lactuca sativa TaxID=4236 RepID=A0A9R1WAU7_LACSA|nr:hypothetical protein LSAT_V11C200052080 [Lactuca sativa]
MGNAKIYDVDLLRGTSEQSFQRLPLYCYNSNKKDPGTVTHIKSSDDNKFEYFFMAIVRAFQRSLCHIIIIDGEHLKGKYFGIMFLVVSMEVITNSSLLHLVLGKLKVESHGFCFYQDSKHIELIQVKWPFKPCFRCISKTLLSPFVDEYENLDRQPRENKDFVLGGCKGLPRF